MFVERNYVMNPEFEDLLFDGTELVPGMIVLIESNFVKEDPSRINEPYAKTRILENNRWATVLRVEIQDRWERDEVGCVIGKGSPLLHMLCEYPDGTKAKRTFDVSYAWIVKKESINA